MDMTVDASKGIECYADADFAGAYDKHATTTHPKDLLSRSGYIVKVANCPIIWASKLGSTLALSTTEAEIHSLSAALREVIFMMKLMDEMKSFGIDLVKNQPVIRCRVFEDNVGAVEVANTPKLRPRTKHIALQYMHFREWTVKGINGEPPRIKVEYISTHLQQADIMTKPIAREQFQLLRKLVCGW